MFFLSNEIEIVKNILLIIKREAALESCSMKQVFCKKLFLNVFFNNCECIHFSTVRDLLLLTLLKSKPLHRYFPNVLTRSTEKERNFAEHGWMVLLESMNYGSMSIKNYRSKSKMTSM